MNLSLATCLLLTVAGLCNAAEGPAIVSGPGPWTLATDDTRLSLGLGSQPVPEAPRPACQQPLTTLTVMATAAGAPPATATLPLTTGTAQQPSAQATAWPPVAPVQPPTTDTVQPTLIFGQPPTTATLQPAPTPAPPTRQYPVVLGLTDTKTKHEWAGGAGLAVPLMDRIWVDGVEVTPVWRFDRAETDTTRQGQLALVFRNDQPQLLLRSVWRARPGRGPIEHWVELENHSAWPITVGHQDSLTLASLTPGQPAELVWLRKGASDATTQGGVSREPLAGGFGLELTYNFQSNDGPVPWLAVQTGETNGLYIGWEFSAIGRLKARTDAAGQHLTLSLGLPEDFRTELPPGETFRVPAAFVGCHAGVLDEGAYSLHQFINAHLRPPIPQGCPDPLVNCAIYYDGANGGGEKLTEADLLRTAEMAADLGCDAFMPDAVWYRQLGDWKWDEKRFPNSSVRVERAVHSRGMKFGLWCAWTNGGASEDPDALAVRGPHGHPDWFSATFGADWKPGWLMGNLLCLASPEARDWAATRTQNLAALYKLDYLKHDWMPLVTDCDKTTHRHHYGVDTMYWDVLGYYAVQEGLLRKGIILENCAAGGHIKDFGVIQRSHYTVTTDNLYNLPDRQSIWDSTYAFPPLILQAYTVDVRQSTTGDLPAPFLWRSGMMSAWQIAPADSRGWNPAESAALKRCVQVYKEWIRPTLPDAHVHHILPRPDGVNWDGLFYWSPGQRRGTVFVFRPDSPEEHRTVKLKGLEAEKNYCFWCEDGAVTSGTRTGAQLMGEGLTLTLPGRYTSDIIYVREAELGEPSSDAPGDAQGKDHKPGLFKLLTAEPKSDLFTITAKLSWEPSEGARFYHVVVADEADFKNRLFDRSTVNPFIELAKLPAKQKLYWQVEAVSPGGWTICSGDHADFTTPELLAMPGAFASDLEWVNATAGAGNQVLRDQNYSGRTLSIAGKPYPKGLWTHSFNDATPADVKFNCEGKNFVLFAADAGVEDTAGPGSVQFQVLVDGKLRAVSPVMKPGVVHEFRVNVSGVKEVTLRVLNGGDNYACDHAAWGFARFLQANAKDPLAKGQ